MKFMKFVKTFYQGCCISKLLLYCDRCLLGHVWLFLLGIKIRINSIGYVCNVRACASTLSCVTNYDIKHSRYFVDPYTGIHTKEAESFWAILKRLNRSIKAGNEEGN